MGDRKGKSCALSFKDSWEGSPERCRHIQKHVLSLTHHCVTCHEHCSSRVPQSTGQLSVRVCVCVRKERSYSLAFPLSTRPVRLFLSSTSVYTQHMRAHTGQCTDGRCSLFMSQFSCLHLAAGTEKPPSRLVPRDS